MTTEVLSNNVFNKIRSKFGDVQLGDSDGNVTADPNEAVFYDFEYMEDADTFGRMSISLADGESMRSEERRVGKECRSRWSPYH